MHLLNLIKTSGLLIATILSAAFIGHYIVVPFMRLTNSLSPEQDNAGRWIGYLERILVSLLVFVGLTSITVFIFATKTAVMGFRISNDNPSERKKQVEYMLLGTMTSYIVALLIGLLGKRLRGMI